MSWRAGLDLTLLSVIYNFPQQEWQEKLPFNRQNPAHGGQASPSNSCFEREGEGGERGERGRGFYSAVISDVSGKSYSLYLD